MSAAKTKACPFCAETIQAAAILCRFCGNTLPLAGEPAVPPPVITPALPAAPSEADRLHRSEALDLLTALVQKSLVVYEEDEEGHGRYRLLETVRQYALDQLAEAGEGEGIRGQHLALFLALAEEAAPQLRGPEQGVWLERLEREHDNLRAALEWCHAEAEDPQLGWRMAQALIWFWDLHNHPTEGREYLARALSREVDRTVARIPLSHCLAGIATRTQNLKVPGEQAVTFAAG